jgi:2-polyprenyl-3-methyl-5-hydroxy-6-metoxy-1,4-benzoquinol methylase
MTLFQEILTGSVSEKAGEPFADLPSTIPLPITPKAQSALIQQLYPAAALGSRLKQRWRPYLSPFASALQAVPPGSRVLDVGCGGGLFLMLLAACDRITAGFGFDRSEDDIRTAQQAMRSSGLESILRFEVRDVEAGIPPDEWPVVSLIDVLHHVPEDHHSSLIRTLSQHVGPGGRLIIREPARRPYWRNLANAIHDLIISRQIVRTRNPEEIEDWLSQSGLQLIQKEATTSLWYGHWLLVFERPLSRKTQKKPKTIAGTDRG